MSREKPDLILLDVSMPVAKLGVKAYLMKSSFSLPELLKRVKQYAADMATDCPPRSADRGSSDADLPAAAD